MEINQKRLSRDSPTSSELLPFEGSQWQRHTGRAGVINLRLKPDIPSMNIFEAKSRGPIPLRQHCMSIVQDNWPTKGQCPSREIQLETAGLAGE